MTQINYRQGVTIRRPPGATAGGQLGSIKMQSTTSSGLVATVRVVVVIQ